MTLGSRKLRQFRAPGFALGHAHLDRPQIGIGEIAVVAGPFFAAHALSELFSLIPEAGFLHHRLTGLVGLDLSLNLVITSLLDRREGVHVLDLHLRAEGSVRSPAHGDVDVATQGTFLHVAVAHTQIAHDAADFRGIFRRFTPRAQIGFADNLSQSNTGAVVIHQGVSGASEAIATGMHKLAGVFFHVKTLDTNFLQIGVFALLGHFHLDPAVFSNRFVVLGDLVVLRQIGVKILLAIELAVFSNVQV